MTHEKMVATPERKDEGNELFPIEVVKKAAPGLLILGITTAFSTLLLIVSTVFVIKLAPIVQSVDSINGRVEAIEKDRAELKPVFNKLTEDMATVKADVSNIKDDTSLIKNYIISK